MGTTTTDGKTMKDFEQDLEKSFKILHEGDIIDVTAIGISDTEITVDLNYYTEGIIPLEECSDDPAFSIKQDVSIGDSLKVMVMEPETADGVVKLSLREANQVLVWDKLKKDYENGTVFTLKITEAVPSGVVGFVRGIRAFIPASQLALDFVADTKSYVGMTVNAVIINLEPASRKLVLSAKMPAKEQALAEKTQKIGKLSAGMVVCGKIERIESYGVFIDIGEGLVGLCHISQITNRFIKSPREEVKLGEEVRAKIIGIEGDRISLSIKALKEDEPDVETEGYEIPDKYRSGSNADSGDENPFAKLLQNVKL